MNGADKAIEIDRLPEHAIHVQRVQIRIRSRDHEDRNPSRVRAGGHLLCDVMPTEDREAQVKDDDVWRILLDEP
jgi:hypothetical protein